MAKWTSGSEVLQAQFFEFYDVDLLPCCKNNGWVQMNETYWLTFPLCGTVEIRMMEIWHCSRSLLSVGSQSSSWGWFWFLQHLLSPVPQGWRMRNYMLLHRWVPFIMQSINWLSVSRSQKCLLFSELVCMWIFCNLDLILLSQQIW